MKKVLTVLVLSLFLGVLVSGCRVETVRDQKQEQQAKYYLYYLNPGETKLRRDPYIPENEDPSRILEDLMRRIANKTLEGNKVNLLPKDVEINTYDPGDNGVLTIDFNRAYEKMSRAREVLVRAGVVKSFTQITGIGAVRFTINGSPLLDSRGSEVGEMFAGDFVEDEGADMDTYRYASFSLYFTDKEGKNLKKETRSLYYRRNIPKEQVILEQLAKGPMEKGNYPTISGNTSVRNVSIADETCYVDLDRNFLDYLPEVSAETAVYSVVNTVLSVCDAKRVQISINGQSDLLFGEGVELYQFFEKNENLVLSESESKE